MCGTGGLRRGPTAELTWGLILVPRPPHPGRGRRHAGRRLANTVGSRARRQDASGSSASAGIGGLVAEVGRAFGMRVVAWSRHLTASAAARQDGELVTKDEFFSRPTWYRSTTCWARGRGD